MKALPYIKAALKTHSKNPVLLTRAGLIFKKAAISNLQNLRSSKLLQLMLILITH
jgi:hypothetical protein